MRPYWALLNVAAVMAKTPISTALRARFVRVDYCIRINQSLEVMRFLKRGADRLRDKSIGFCFFASSCNSA